MKAPPRKVARRIERVKRPRQRGGPSPPVKITTPAILHVYRRTRLFGLLDHARRTRQLTWIAAPAGAGKTTLTVSYIESRKLDCMWYQLDAGDRDLASFFHYLGLAVARAAPRFRRPLPKLTPEYLGGIGVFARNFFRELGRRVRSPFMLVLDNMQEFAAGERFHELLSEGLSELPRCGHAVLLSRAEPPEPFARLRVNQKMAELGWDEMRLTEEELGPLARVLDPGERSTASPAIETLHRRCDGWIAGLILLLGVSEKEAAAAEAMAAGTRQKLFDYFAAEVFARRPSAEQDFLILTALFPSFTASMAEQLTGYARARALVSDLVREHHFTERRTESDIYQYHALFREFLLERAQARLDAVAISRYRHRAATILEEAGDLEQALILFLEVGDADAATRLILSQAQELTAAGRYATLRELIERLPPAALQKNPWMLYWRGISSFLFAPVESARDFAQAYERFEERNDVTGLLLAWSGVVDAVWHQQTDWKQLDPWISRLEAQLHPDWEFPSNEVAARVISSLFWVLLWHRPTHPKMAHWAEEAARLWERADEFSIRLRLGVGLCSYYLLVAEASRFRTLGEPQRQLARRKDVSPDAALLARLVSIYVSTYDGFYQEASERMREALEAASAAGIHVFDCLLYGAALYAALGREDLPAADQLLDSMGAVLVALPTNLDTGHYRLHGSWRARLVGDVRHAVQQAESAVEIAARIGAYYPEIMCRYGLAHAYLMGGDLAGAQRENGIARAKAQAANFNWWRHLCGLFDAYLAFERAEEMSGVERLREALALQERFDIGYLLPFWSKAMIARLCVKAFEHGVATDYVRKLLRVRRPDAAEVPLHLTTWPWPIKIYTLSSFAVLIDDKPLKFSTKAQRKPLDLLKVLIALGGRNVREDKLAEILWPDSEADSAAFALTTTVHRLRRLIGDAALERQEGCLNLDPRYCWVDVWAVEHQLAAIEEASRAAPPAAIAELVDRVLALYRGPFLADQREESWVLSMRERLRGRLLRVIGLASDALTGARHYAQAIQYLEKVLEIDPLVEHFHRSIMQVHLTQGHHAAALAAYRRCRKALTTHLGLEPSADTEALRRQIPTA